MKLALVIAIAYFSGVILYNLNIYGCIFLLFLGFFLYMLFRQYNRTTILIVLFVLSYTNFVGLVDMETVLHLPGLFRFSDLLFFLLSCLFFRDIKYFLNIQKRLRSPLSIWIWLFIIYVIFESILTIFEYKIPWVYAFREGRLYMLYLLFFFVIASKDIYSKKRICLNILFVVAIIQAFAIIMQFVFRGNLPLFQFQKITEQAIQNQYVFRVYPAAEGILKLMTSVSMCYVLFAPVWKIKLRFALITLFLYIAGMLTFWRTYWMQLGLFFLIPLILLAIKDKKRAIVSMVVAFLLIFCVSSFALIVPKIRTLVSKRFTQTVDDFQRKRMDTVRVRINENIDRMLLVKNNWIFGLKFLHGNYFVKQFGTIFVEGRNSVRNNDSGIISWITVFGFVGFVWILLFSVVVFTRLYKLLLNSSSFDLKVVLTGIAVYYFAQLVTCYTTGGVFTNANEIAVFAFILGWVEIVSYNETNMLKINKE